MTRTFSRALFVFLLFAARPAVALDVARVELIPPTGVSETFEPVGFEVLVFLEGEPVPTLPEELGFRVIGGKGAVAPRWRYDAETNSWRYHLEFRPTEFGLSEVEVYHRELSSLGARARFTHQVLRGTNQSAPTLYRVEGVETYRQLDLENPIFLLPGGTLHLLATVDDGAVERLTFVIDRTRDLTIEPIAAGQVIVRAAAEPATPGARRELIVADLAQRRPTIRLPIVVLLPCTICGGPHNEDIHPRYDDLDADVITSQPTPPPDLDLLEVGDCVRFKALNLVEPAPAYLETGERTVVIRGWTTPRLDRLDVVVTYADGDQRYFPALILGAAGAFTDPEELRRPFTHTFRLHDGANRLTYLVTDHEGTKRSVEFMIVRKDSSN